MTQRRITISTQNTRCAVPAHQSGRHRPLAAVILFGLLGTAQASLAAPSFDCKQAASAAEHTICTFPELARLDLDIAVRYAKLRATLTPQAAQALRTDQRHYLADLNAAPKPATPDVTPHREPVRQALQHRLTLLNAIQTTPPPSLAGQWRNHHGTLTITGTVTGTRAGTGTGTGTGTDTGAETDTNSDPGTSTGTDANTGINIGTSTSANTNANVFEFSASAAEQNTGRWTCTLEGKITSTSPQHGIATSADAPDWTLSLQSQDTTLHITEHGPAHTAPPYCGLNGTLSGVYFYIGHAEPQPG